MTGVFNNVKFTSNHVKTMSKSVKIDLLNAFYILLT